MWLPSAILPFSLFGPFPLQEAPEPSLRLVPPASWTRLDIPAQPLPPPRYGASRHPAAEAVVEVVDRAPEAEDRLIQLRLASEATESLSFSPGSLARAELNAFLAEAQSPRPDFAKAQLSTLLNYWIPRPFHLETDLFRIHGSKLRISSSLGVGRSSGPLAR